MAEMFVTNVGFDPLNDYSVIVLTDKDQKRALLICVGIEEGDAIQKGLSGVKQERPLTHDLLLNTIHSLGYSVKQIEIRNIEADMFFAAIQLVSQQKVYTYTRNDNEENEQEIEARPSDAIAIAVREGAPILISPKVMAEGSVLADVEQERIEKTEFQKFLADLKATDFNAYNKL